MKLPRWFHQFGSPPYVYRLADRLCPWLGFFGVALLAIGAFWGLVIAPPDYQQGESARIMYIHPQTAYIGMMAYVVMAVAAAEVAVGLAILSMVYRNVKSIDINLLTRLKN